MVAVSFDYAFVFLKTRKTAGTSIEMALEPFCRSPGAVIQEKTSMIRSRQGIIGRRLTHQAPFMNRLLRRTDWYNHMLATEVRDALGDKRWASLRKITSVRNPFDLAVSKFHWKLMNRGGPVVKDFGDIRRQFNEFVKSGGAIEVSDSNYKIVHIDGELVVEHVVRFEHITGDLQKLAADIGLDPERLQLPHTKKTSDRRPGATAEYFDDTTVEIIRRSSAWVFDRFGYATDPREASSAAS